MFLITKFNLMVTRKFFMQVSGYPVNGKRLRKILILKLNGQERQGNRVYKKEVFLSPLKKIRFHFLIIYADYICTLRARPWRVTSSQLLFLYNKRILVGFGLSVKSHLW